MAIIVGILALLNIFAGAAVISRLPDGHSVGAWLLVVLFFLVQLSGPFGARLFFARRRRQHAFLIGTVDWISYLAFGAMSCLVFYGLVAVIVTLVWQVLAPPANEASFDRWILLVLAAATGATVVIGLVQASIAQMVKRVDIPLPTLPQAFDGFTIAQISDLHVGPTIGRGAVQRVVDIANGLAPDLIALTGDFVDGTVADLGDDVAPLADLRAAHGVFLSPAITNISGTRANGSLRSKSSAPASL